MGAAVMYEVPQRSVLSPLLFSICLLPLGKLQHGVSFNCHADNTQLYIHQNNVKCPNDLCQHANNV